MRYKKLGLLSVSLLIVVTLILVACGTDQPEFSIENTPARVQTIEVVSQSTVATAQKQPDPTETIHEITATTTPESLPPTISEPTFPTELPKQERLPITASNANRLVQYSTLGNGTFNDLDWSPDGELIAVASSVGPVLFETEELSMFKTIPIERGAARVEFSSDGKLLASSQ